MEDVLDLYQPGYHPERPVVCFDETSRLDFVHLGGVGEDVCELSVNCGWGFSAVGFQPRQCNISVGQPQHEVRRFRYVSNFCTKSSQAIDWGGASAHRSCPRTGGTL